MKTLILSLLICCTGLSAFAQVIRQNERGEKIIVYPDGSWKYFNQKQGGGGTDYPVYEASVTPFDNPVLLTEQDALKIATRRAQLAREATSIALDRATKATEQRQKLEHDFALASSRESADSEILRRFNIRLSAARKTEVESKNEALIAQQELAKAEDLTRKGDILQTLRMAEAARKSQVYYPKADALSADFFSSIVPTTPYYQDFIKSNPYYGLEKQEQCKFQFNGKDNTGRTRKELDAQHLFSFTDEKLRMFLKEKEYLSCKGYLSSLDGGYRYLTLEFTFSTPNAREAYGFIEKGSVLTIRLINGNFINLRSGTMDRGSYDTRVNLLTYRVHYAIAQDQMSFLSKSEVDKIRVFWSSGYEEYEVYQLDFFMKQLACLDK
jgi:hypothetical protein